MLVRAFCYLLCGAVWVFVSPTSAFACTAWTVDNTSTTCVAAGICKHAGKVKTVTTTYESRKCSWSWRRETRTKQRSVCGC